MNKISLYVFLIVAIIVLVIVYFFYDGKGNLNKIKATKVGDGQYGDADWASANEIRQKFTVIPYEPKLWRQGENIPTYEGIILGAIKHGKKVEAIIDTSDNHTMIVSASGGGKTSSLLYPNIEYLCAVGMSAFITDTKGSIYKEYAPICKQNYGYNIHVIDLRYPNCSDSYNLMYLVNKYMDKHLSNGSLSDKAKAETYAKNIGNNIIHMEGMKNAGANQFFYDSAEGIISAICLLVSELCPKPTRHIVSVFKIIRQLMEIIPESIEKKAPQTYLQELYFLLPEEHRAKDLLSPSATVEFKAMSSILSTAMSKMLSFIDSEIEQMICFDDGFNVEDFVNQKSIIFFVIDEKSQTRNFMLNLVMTQFYGELLYCADYLPNNTLPHRVYIHADEFGTYSGIPKVDQMFSAARSRNILFVPYLQTTAQLNKNYDKDIAEIIKSNCQNVMFSFQSPTSNDAEVFSKKLGTQTVKSGSISHKSGASSSSSQTSYQMIKKPLMTPDEITNLEKGQWRLMKSGMNPAKMTLLKCEDWGIEIDKANTYTIECKANRNVEYADRTMLITAVKEKYHKQNTKIEPLF